MCCLEDRKGTWMFKDRVTITEYNEPSQTLQIKQKHSLPGKDVHTALTENSYRIFQTIRCTPPIWEESGGVRLIVRM